MDWTERSFMRFVPLGAAVLLLVVGIARILQRRKPRSFRDDPIGALKDRSEIIADRAQEASEEALARLQEIARRDPQPAAGFQPQADG